MSDLRVLLRSFSDIFGSIGNGIGELLFRLFSGMDWVINKDNLGNVGLSEL